jgi:hypothetical protein
MFSQLYGTGCTTLCAMSASVQEKQAALSQLPARLLPPAVRAPPAAMRAKIDRLARHQFGAFGYTALQQGQVDWVTPESESDLFTGTIHVNTPFI